MTAAPRRGVRPVVFGAGVCAGVSWWQLGEIVAARLPHRAHLPNRILGVHVPKELTHVSMSVACVTSSLESSSESEFEPISEGILRLLFFFSFFSSFFRIPVQWY